MYSLAKIARILGCPEPPYLPIHECVIDSRLVRPGDLFFALEGEKTDGHLYLKEVSLRGAFAACVSKSYQGEDFGLVLFKVDDVRMSLHLLAKEILKERSSRVIGITGSQGKTSTREALFTLLSKKWKVHRNPHNYNSQATFALSILNGGEDADFLILEMAMSEKGQIQKLREIAPPEMIILTEIHFAHASHFGSIEEIAAAKAEIFHPAASFAVVHEKSIRFGVVRSSLPEKYEVYPEPLQFPSPFKEKHLTDNVSAAVLMAKHLGLTDHEIRERAKLIHPFKGRFEKKEVRGVTLIDDTYNASPGAVLAALANMPAPSGSEGRKIAILGSMKELGAHSEELHQEVGEEAAKKVDALFCIGEECTSMVETFHKMHKPVVLFSNQEELYQAVKGEIKKGDVVLVKGARSHKLEGLVTLLEKEIGL